jgi:hypothetical protein
MMKKTSGFSLQTYLLFPGIAMLLGWGLRGYIGGGPFGAMIPGAMVALAISMLLGFKPNFTALVVVFGVAGVGLGGEMTYGQTLSFLRNPDTVWWGILATFVKGAVWGLGGGAILALGLIHNRIPKKTVLMSLAILLIGLIVGFKLINDPKLIYFSDPINKPRDESWGGLLIGALALIGYLKYTVSKENFRIISRFALWGTISGGLGFGLGGLWFVLGSYLPGVIFKSWWKMMEFSFGLLLGMGLGYAAWLSRNELSENTLENETSQKLSLKTELSFIFLISLVVYLIIPGLLEPLGDKMSYENGIASGILGDILRIFVNYGFYGLLMVWIALYKKSLAWQIGITLTFCHTAVDLLRDMWPQSPINPWIQLIIVSIMTLVVAYLVAKYRRGENINNSMFQILVWSCITIAFANISFRLFSGEGLKETGIAFLMLRVFFVHIVFLSSAIYVSIKSVKINKPLIS